MSQEARNAELDRVVNLLLREVQERVKDREETQRLRESVHDATLAMHVANARGERLERQLTAVSKSQQDLTAELSAYLPEIRVVTKMAADAAANAAKMANQAHQSVEQGRKETKEAHDKTDKFVLEAVAVEKEKGPWTHFLDRFDRVSTRTWILTFILLILGLVTVGVIYIADVGIKTKQEAPHVRDKSLPASPASEPKSNSLGR